MSPKIKKPLDIYVRVSRVGGREGDSFISPKVQEERCRALATARGYSVGMVFTDLDASGGTMDRPEFNKALERIREGISGGIIVARIDRFSRTMQGALNTLEEIEAAGGYLIECDGDWDTSTAMGRFGRDLVLRISQLFREQVTEGWNTTRAKAVERGVHIGKTPLGYLRDDESRLHPDPETAPHVAEAFAMRARAESWRSIYRYLAETCPGRIGSLKAAAKLVSNRVYVGEARSGEHVREGAHEAIVSEGEYQAAKRSTGPNERLARTSRGTHSNGALLAGQLRCAGCGGRMTATYTVRAGKRYEFYRCQTNEECSAKASIGSKIIEPHVEAVMLATLASPDAERGTEAFTPDTAELDRAVERAKLDLEAWDDAFDSDSDPVAFKRGRERRKAALAEAEAARAEAAVALAQTGEQARFATLWQAGSPEAVEALWRSLPVPDRRKIIAGMFPVLYVSKGRGPVEERLSLSRD